MQHVVSTKQHTRHTYSSNTCMHLLMTGVRDSVRCDDMVEITTLHYTCTVHVMCRSQHMPRGVYMSCSEMPSDVTENELRLFVSNRVCAMCCAMC